MKRILWTVLAVCITMALTGTALAATYTLSGTVTQACHIELYNDDTDQVVDSGDFPGAYSFSNLSNGNYYLKIWPSISSGYIMQRYPSVSSDPLSIMGGDLPGQNVTLSSGAKTISGRVSGAPENTRVNCDYESLGIGTASYTDAAGNYTLGTLPSGVARVQVQPSISSGYAFSQERYINLASSMTNFNIVLKKGALITGTVTGYAWKYVNIDGKNGSASAQTDGSGNYQVRIAPGTYVISIDAPSPDKTSGKVATPLDITVTDASITYGNNNLTTYAYAPGHDENIARITGAVTFDWTSGSVQIVVMAFKAGTLANLSINNADSLITVAMASVVDLGGGNYGYTLRVPPGANCDICLGTAIASDETGLTAFTLHSTPILNVAVPAAGGVQPSQSFSYGDSRNDGTITGIAKFNGTAAVNAQVILSDATHAFLGMADTDANGAYTFHNVRAGTYTVRAMMPYSDGLKSGTSSVIVVATQTVAAGDLNMLPDYFNNLFNPADLVGNGSKALAYNFGTAAGQGYWAFENNTTWKQIDYTDTTGLTFGASADLDGNGYQDLVFHFGDTAGKGYWAFENNATWKQIEYTDTTGLTFQGTADLDGNGSKDLLFNFGTDVGKGFWAYENNSTWKKIDYTDTTGISLKTATDLDGNGAQDLIFSFGTDAGKGYWAYENNTTWKKIDYTDTTGISLLASSDLDGNGQNDLIFDFGSTAGKGVWAYENNATWKKIDYTDASGVTLMAAADLDGNGSKDLVFNFGTGLGQGYWAFANNSTWMQIQYTDTTGVTLQAVADVDGNGSQDLIFNFGTNAGQGYWAYENNTTWKKIDYTDASGVTLMAATDLDGNGSKDLVFDFGSTAGYWAFENNTTWKKIDYTDTTGITLQAVTDLDGNGANDLIFNFGTNVGEGCWAFENNTTWKKIDYTDTTGITLPQGDTDAIARMNFESTLNPQGNASYYRMRGDMILKPA